MTFPDKYTIVFDGNHFLHKTLHVVKKISETNWDLIENVEADRNLLLWKLSLDFASEIKKFSAITENVVYSIDAHSWRKDYFPEEYLDSNPNEKYKGTRKAAPDIDWNEVYKVHDEFAEALSKQGVKVRRIDGAEADDIIFACSTYLNSVGKNCLIISGDNDLIQLVNHDETNGTNTIYYHKNKQGFYTSEGFQRWLNKDSETIDIFNQPITALDDVKEKLRRTIKAFPIFEVNSEEFQFTKILVGDAGDNVKSLYTKEMKYGSGKKIGETYYRRLTSGQSQQILKSFKEFNKDLVIDESIFWNKEYIDQICKLAKKICKIDFMTHQEIVQNYEDNRNLMILNAKALPPTIVEIMLKEVSELSKNNLSSASINNLRSSDSILENTTYTKVTQEKQSNAGFFGSFDLD